jgi:hypothetical protein
MTRARRPSWERPPQPVAGPRPSIMRSLAILALTLGTCAAVPAVESWMVEDGFLADDERQLEEVAAGGTAKRKTCPITNLPGDYRYEACGEFCKEPKAGNHCRYCKCKSCSFCQARLADVANQIHDNKVQLKAKRKARKAAAAGDAGQTVTVQVQTGAKKRKNKGAAAGTTTTL